MQRYVAEEGDGMGGAFASYAFGTEDRGCVGAVRAGEERHVLDHADDLGWGLRGLVWGWRGRKGKADEKGEGEKRKC